MNAHINTEQHAPVVETADLLRQLSGQTILQNISLNLAPGDVVGLLGKNGSGKTTLLETLLGFGYPAYGHSLLWGEVATELSGESKQRIGYVPQKDELPPEMTAKQLFFLYRQLRPRWNDELVEALMPAWELSENKRIRRMSEGQKQKLAIVLALAHEPDLLVLDEPVASLDPIARRQFFQQLMDFASSEDRAIIFSSHIVSDMERIVNRVWCLQDGRLSCDMPLDDLYDSVKRVQYSGQLSAEALKNIPGVLYREQTSTGGYLIAKDWSAERAQELRNSGLQEISVLGMSLEEIFLAWHGGNYAKP